MTDLRRFTGLLGNTLVRFQALATLVVLAGCARTMIPTPNLYARTEINPFAHVPEALQGTTIDLLYITDRKPIENDYGRTEYGYERSVSMAFGSAKVEIGRDITWDQLVEASRTQKRSAALPMEVVSITEQHRFPDTPPPIVVDGDQALPTTEYTTARQQVIDALHDELRRRIALTTRSDVYIFVHGFNNDFDHAAFRMAELWHFLGREGVPVIYTWPAGAPGLLKGYTRDRESGEFTLLHLKETIKAIASCPEVERIHLIAHSRGTDILATALNELIVRARIGGHDPGEVFKIGNMVMAAPDLDVDVMFQRFSDMLFDGFELQTVYVTPDDGAIGAAEWLFSSPRRLGTLRPEDMTVRERERLERIPNADIIDSRVRSAGHGYFLSNPAVLSDLILVLRYGCKPGAENGRPLTPVLGNYYILDKDYPLEAAPLPEDEAPALNEAPPDDS